ncbi:MAG: Rpn family recombination-promoting nuclease/putative transposase [Magnetococcus sp. YQC-5]
MNEISQPHDRLFRTLLSTPETAGALLREYLPPEVSRLLAPEPPQLVDGTFVEETLRPYFSDRLFEAKTISGKPICFYTLIEHKSYKEEKVGWQIYRGISAFFEQKTRENAQWNRLPAVMALLVYNGGREWCFPNEFLALVDADEALIPWQINFRYPVVDLGPIPNRELAKHALLRAGLMALKYGTRDPESQMAALDQIVDALIEAPELLLPVLLYSVDDIPPFECRAYAAGGPSHQTRGGSCHDVPIRPRNFIQRQTGMGGGNGAPGSPPGRPTGR